MLRLDKIKTNTQAKERMKRMRERSKIKSSKFEFPVKPIWRNWELQEITINHEVKAIIRCIYCNQKHKTIPNLFIHISKQGKWTNLLKCKDSCTQQLETYHKELRTSTEIETTRHNPWEEKDKEWQDEIQSHPDY